MTCGSLILFLFLFTVKLVEGNVCVVDDHSTWVSMVFFDVEDFAYSAKLNNYTCFDGCTDTDTVTQSYKLKVPGTLTLKSQRRIISSEGDFINGPDYCPSDTMRDNIQKNVDRAVSNTAKSVLLALQYNMALPGGWTIGVVKNGQGWADAPHNQFFCFYNAQYYNDYYQISMAYVG